MKIYTNCASKKKGLRDLKPLWDLKWANRSVSSPDLTVKPWASAATLTQRCTMLSQSYKSRLGISAVQHPGCLFFERMTHWLDVWLRRAASSWRRAVAADREQSPEVTAVRTRQSHSLAKWTRGPGIFFAAALQCKQSVSSCIRVTLTANCWWQNGRTNSWNKKPA